MLNRIMMFLFLLIICGTVTISFIKYDTPHIFFKNNKKYQLSICALFKNEAKYLKEWIEYHRIFGVDHFYLYNIGSEDAFQEVLRPYIDEGIVTFFHWPEMIAPQDDRTTYTWALSTQIPAYENAWNFIALYETKWLVFIDIDEFLVCPKEMPIKDLLKKYKDFSGISLSSDFFDASIHDHSSPPKKIIIQTSELASPPKQIAHKTVTKMIFKPELCLGFCWPPYQCQFKDDESSIAVDRKELRINRYINRNVRNLPEQEDKFKLDIDPRLLSEKEIALFLDSGFVIEAHDRAIDQHIPELLKRIGEK